MTDHNYGYCNGHNTTRQITSRNNKLISKFHLEHTRPYKVLDIEIDLGPENCNPAITCCGDHPKIPLYNNCEIPSFLGGNPYIIHGYRAMLPFSLCCKSMVVWSNESINFWSHAIGFILFLGMNVYDNMWSIPDIGGSLSDHVILSLGIICFKFCLMCSAGYHLFCCHSERAYQRWLALDLTGIAVALLGCYLPAVHYAFYCDWLWRDIYLIIITILFVSVLTVQTSRLYVAPQHWVLRISVYVALVLYGIIPTVHWVALQGGFNTPIVQQFVPKVVVMYFLGLLAFGFYITKFPERYLPGKFDYIGSSHQWWHVIVIAAFLWWRQAGLDILKYRVDIPCLLN